MFPLFEMATYQLDFVSIGCNRVAGCTDWGQNKLLAYSGGNFVVIYNVEGGQVLATLPGHTGRVNAVKWIPQAEARMCFLKNVLVITFFLAYPKRLVVEETELVSAGSEGDIRVWKKGQNVMFPSFFRNFFTQKKNQF